MGSEKGVNWYWSADGIFGDVKQTDEDVDGEFVFATFREARAALAKNFDDMASQYRMSARDARRTPKDKW